MLFHKVSTKLTKQPKSLNQVRSGNGNPLGLFEKFVFTKSLRILLNTLTDTNNRQLNEWKETGSLWKKYRSGSLSSCTAWTHNLSVWMINRARAFIDSASASAARSPTFRPLVLNEAGCPCRATVPQPFTTVEPPIIRGGLTTHVVMNPLLPRMLTATS